MSSARSHRPPSAAPPPSTVDPADMLLFAAIAHAGGVRGAAERLHMPRSTVSRRLAQLEAAVGAPLVIRTSRRFALTEVGAGFAAKCDELEALVRSAESFVSQASSEPAGVLRVAVAPVLAEEYLAGAFAEFARRYPRVQLDLRLSPDYVDLRRDEVDVAVRTGPLENATDLFAVKLGTSVTGCFVSPAYRKARGVPQTPQELVRHDCLVVGRHARPAWTFGLDGDVRIPVSPRIRLDSFRLARSLAAEGCGVLRVSSAFAAPLVRSGELVAVLEPYWQRVTLFAVHATTQPPPMKLRVFISLLREALSNVLPLGAEPRRG